jgi:hypothetical protein
MSSILEMNGVIVKLTPLLPENPVDFREWRRCKKSKKIYFARYAPR